MNLIEEWRFSDYLDTPESVKKEFSEIPPNVYGFGHTKLYADVIDTIRNERDPLVDAENNVSAFAQFVMQAESSEQREELQRVLREKDMDKVIDAIVSALSGDGKSIYPNVRVK